MKDQSASEKKSLIDSNKFKVSQDIIEYASDAIIIGDKNGVLVKVNTQMCELTGYSANEIIGKHIHFLFPVEEMEKKPLKFNLIDQGIPVLKERNILKKDGSFLPIEMHSNKIEDGYISVIRDISKRKETERQLKEHTDRLSFVTKMEKIGIIDYDIESKEITHNEEMCKIMNFDSKVNCTQFDKWISLIHPDDKYRVQECMNRVIDEKVTLDFVYRIIDPITAKEKTIKASTNVKTSLDDRQAVIITSVDITDTNLLKSKLREGERTFHSLSETAASAIFIYREKFIYVNTAFETITGYSKQDAPELFFWDIIHPEHRNIVKERGLNRISGQTVINRYELKIKTKSGETKWIELTADKIDYLGKPAGLGTAFDITDRKNAEKAYRKTNLKLKEEQKKAIESENRFRQYLDQNSAPMLAIEPQSKNIIFSNQAAAKLYGYSKDEIHKMSIYDIQTLSDEEVNQAMKLAIKNDSNKFQFIHKTKNGKLIDVLVNASPVMIDDKITMILIIRNITDEIETKLELEKSHNTYRNIINSISEMVYILGEDAKFKFVNKAAKNTYGYEFSEFFGKTPQFLSAPGLNDMNAVVEMVQSAFHGNIESFEFYGLKKNGDIFPKEVILSPGIFFGEKVVIAVSRDITKQKAITNELILSKNKAEESDQLKSAFLANMSHEIRTPMNAILGFSELLKESDMEEGERLRFLQIITKSSYHLLNLINDLVDISKIQANQMSIVINSFELNSLLEEVKQYFEGELQNSNKQNSVKLIFSYGLENQTDSIKTDATRLRQILHNIIGNAIKFTEKGEIKVSYTVNNNLLIFTIIDDGIGIPKDKQNKIFERFSQADHTISEEFGGTGLGLSISKACAELLGGEITCESEEKMGTKMQFSISYLRD